MPRRTPALLFATTLVGLIGGIAVHALNAHQGPAADQPLSEQGRARLLATGRELFTARCARCHDERGDKPLKTGPPLNERGLSSEQIGRAVSGRLRDKTEEERRAVTLYISSLMKAKDSEEKAPPKPCLSITSQFRRMRALPLLQNPSPTTAAIAAVTARLQLPTTSKRFG